MAWTGFLYFFFIALTFILTGCKNVASYPIDAPNETNKEDRIIGKWKFEEDTNKKNFYAISKSVLPFEYHVKFWNRGGTNPTYEANTFLSAIGPTRFINVPYFEEQFSNMGYIFLEILETNENLTKMTVAVVTDTKMRALQNSAAVKTYISQHMTDPSFFRDTFHFYKIP